MIAVLSYASKEIIYNNEKGHYEVWDKEKHRIIGIIKGENFSSNRLKKNISTFPYQPGFPAQIPSGCEGPLVIGDINADNYKDILAVTMWNDNFLFDYTGNLIRNINFGYRIPIFYDFNFDGINEIIGNEYCNGFCGITAKKYTGEKLSGFPNPPGTLLTSSSVVDIDRDGNEEVAFAVSEKDSTANYGLYILGSWGGILSGFPVIFPCIIPATGYGPGENYASPTIGDFDDDGIMEIVATAANERLYLIRADGSYYRNWPIRIWGGSMIDVNPPSLGDIDHDGKLEIATTDGAAAKLYVFKEDASMLHGFPVDIDWFAYGSPVLADIDKDGKLELYAADISWRLFGYKNDGSSLPGWPINVNNEMGTAFFYVPPTIGDIDGDGQMEIIDAGATCEWCPTGFIVAHKFDAHANAPSLYRPPK